MFAPCVILSHTCLNTYLPTYLKSSALPGLAGQGEGSSDLVRWRSWACDGQGFRRRAPKLHSPAGKRGVCKPCSIPRGSGGAPTMLRPLFRAFDLKASPSSNLVFLLCLLGHGCHLMLWLAIVLYLRPSTSAVQVS